MIKKSQNSRNEDFSYYFCMIEGSASGAGSVPLTNGSGSVMPKNLWIRIRNTKSEKGEISTKKVKTVGVLHMFVISF
jgi:hypothetical protein